MATYEDKKHTRYPTCNIHDIYVREKGIIDHLCRSCPPLSS